MWENTFMVVSSDNGGPIYRNGSAGGNNFPLRGGKKSNFEGGVRVNAFVTGGLVPEARRGQVEAGFAASEDWFRTLAGLAGVLSVPIFNAFPGMGSEILISALVVVVVGGMGSLAGALIASLLIGAATVVGQIYAAEFSTAVIYLVLVVVLLVRPQGLMGVAR
jgi:hypothetical protein